MCSKLFIMVLLIASLLLTYLSVSCEWECNRDQMIPPKTMKNINESDECPGQQSGYQFKAVVFDIEPDKKDTFYEELSEPMSLLHSPASAGFRNEIESLKSLIIIKLRIVNVEKTVKGVSYIVIDHVFNEKEETVQKLLHTIVFKIQQEQIALVYTMKYLALVNGYPQEEVINKESHNFKGCFSSFKNSTCGTISIDKKMVPFSEGFCCSCDTDVNREREANLVELCKEWKNKCTNESLFTSKKKQLFLKYLPLIADDDKPYEKNKLSPTCVKQLISQHCRDKRSVTKSGNQIRGGQSCIDRTYPHGVDPITYHESAHCLRFSKLWYSTYQLQDPRLEHVVTLEVYKKRHVERGSASWVELTRGSSTIMGTDYRRYFSQKYGLILTYNDAGNVIRKKFCLLGQNYLLKPTITFGRPEKFPMLKGGTKEFLVVDQSLFDFGGGSCDKIGVSFLAFAKQKNRCDVPKGSCLCNQPYALWLYDKNRKRKGLKGNFFLENFATLPRKNYPGNEFYGERLQLDYYGEHESKLSLGMDNFVDNVISLKPRGIISEIYVDAVNEYSTTFIINIINDGLIPFQYKIAIRDLPEPMPKIWHNLISKNFSVDAHHGYSIKLQMYGKVPIERFHCTIELLSSSGLELASRRIAIQNNDRCYCLWECRCACEASKFGLRCDVLDQTSFNQAGYQGAPPPSRPRRRRKPRSYVIETHKKTFTIFAFIMGMSLGLLVMGVINASVRVIVYWLVCCCCLCRRMKKKRPKWRKFNIKILDTALIPLFLSFDKYEVPNNFIVNIFHFFLLIPAFLCLICHLLKKKKEIFGDIKDNKKEFEPLKRKMPVIKYRRRTPRTVDKECEGLLKKDNIGEEIHHDIKIKEIEESGYLPSDAPLEENELPSTEVVDISSNDQLTVQTKRLWIEEQRKTSRKNP